MWRDETTHALTGIWYRLKWLERNEPLSNAAKNVIRKCKDDCWVLGEAIGMPLPPRKITRGEQMRLLVRRVLKING